MERELDNRLKLGVLQPSSSPWASPVVLVEKKKDDVRFCVDFRKLNQVAVFEAYPMPQVYRRRPGECGPAKYVSTMDLARGYWQLPLAEEKTAFTTPFGLLNSL